MDENKVFVGYNQELERCLLYQNSEHTYIDLETGNNYYDFEILETPRINYNKLVESSKNQSRWKIKREFQKTENEIISLEDVFIGNVHQVTEVLKYATTLDRLLNFGIKYDLKTVPLLYNRLLKRDKFLSYTDLFTGEKYNDKMEIYKGSFYVPDNRGNLRSFNQIVGECYTELPKKKILKRYQEKYDLEKTYRRY